MKDELVRRARLEQLPLAVLVRRAVTEFVELIGAGVEPDVDLRRWEDPLQRLGPRGPVPKWQLKITYVLDDEVSERLHHHAEARGTKVSSIVRQALASALGAPDADRA